MNDSIKVAHVATVMKTSTKLASLVYADGPKAGDDVSFNVREGDIFGFLGPNS
jgi:ABC-type multidrug transport system ATPase subunit